MSGNPPSGAPLLEEPVCRIPARHGQRNPLDPRRPYAFFIETERAASGEIVPVTTIFLTNRECPWRCVYCDLWKNALEESVPPGAIPEQIDFALARLVKSGAAVPAACPDCLSSLLHRDLTDAAGTAVSLCTESSRPHLKLYNAGSFFDARAIPPEDYPAIAERARGFAHLVVECHPALVNERVLRFRDLLPPGVTLEVAMGLETANREVLGRLNKGMSLEDFARAAALLRLNGIALRSFILVKPPFESDESSALRWAKRSIDFAFDCHTSVAVLIPMRVGDGALDGLARQGDCAPPALATIEAALDYGIGLRRGRVFADVWDLAKCAHCEACLPARRERLTKANLQQRLDEPVRCGRCGNG